MRKSVSSLGWVHWILAHQSFELYHSDMQGLERDEMKRRGKLARCQETWLKLGLWARRKQWQQGHESVSQVQAHLGATRAHTGRPREWPIQWSLSTCFFWEPPTMSIPVSFVPPSPSHSAWTVSYHLQPCSSFPSQGPQRLWDTDRGGLRSPFFSILDMIAQYPCQTNC